MIEVLHIDIVLFRYFVLINGVMIVLLQIPYWIFDKEIGGYVEQIIEYSKGTITRSLHHDDLQLLTELTDIYRNAVPQLKRSFSMFLFCNLLCFGGMFVPLYFLFPFFGFDMDFLKNGTNYNVTIIRAKIEAKLPSSGECTLEVKDPGFTLREKTFQCNINYAFLYEFITIGIITIYLIGILVIMLDFVALLCKCVFPELRR